jgi:hypothetical protein
VPAIAMHDADGSVLLHTDLLELPRDMPPPDTSILGSFKRVSVP